MLITADHCGEIGNRIGYVTNESKINTNTKTWKCLHDEGMSEGEGPIAGFAMESLNADGFWLCVMMKRLIEGLLTVFKYPPFEDSQSVQDYLARADIRRLLSFTRVCRLNIIRAVFRIEGLFRIEALLRMFWIEALFRLKTLFETLLESAKSLRANVRLNAS